MGQREPSLHLLVMVRPFFNAQINHRTLRRLGWLRYNQSKTGSPAWRVKEEE